jgi:hypothetical protein
MLNVEAPKHIPRTSITKFSSTVIVLYVHTVRQIRLAKEQLKRPLVITEASPHSTTAQKTESKAVEN